MANEISANLSVTINSAGNSVAGASQYLASLSGTGFIGNDQTVGTTAEALLFGDVGANPAIVFVKNTDSTNFVQIDSISTMVNFPQTLLPGQSVVLLPATGTIYAKADTAPCNCWVVAA